MKVLFLDRDGIINVAPPVGEYVVAVSELQWMEGLFAVLRQLAARDFQFVVVTNQRCVARGLVAPAEMEEINGEVYRKFEQEGLTLRKIYVCPHEKGVCQCRKPEPGMVLRAEEEFGIELGRSYLLGDNVSDLEAAHAAQLAGGFLYDPEGDKGFRGFPDFPVEVVVDFAQILDFLLE